MVAMQSPVLTDSDRLHFDSYHFLLCLNHSSEVSAIPGALHLAHMIKGTDCIATQPAFMKLGLLKSLDSAPLPFNTEPLNLFLVWHRRESDDPAHQWLRRRIIETVISFKESDG